VEKSEQEFVVEIPEIALMSELKNSKFTGIVVKLAQEFLHKYELTWNDKKFDKAELFEKTIKDPDRHKFKLNPIMITKKLNLPKKYITVVLYNIFDVIGLFLQNCKECVIELSQLGSLNVKLKTVFHYQRTKWKIGKYSIHKNSSIQFLLNQHTIIEENSIKMDNEKLDKLMESNK